MIVLWAWVGAAVLAVLVLGIAGYDLLGRIKRLRRAMDMAVTDLLPQVQALMPESGHGRHRANPGIPDGTAATGGKKP